VSWLPLVLAVYWLGVAFQAFDTVHSLGWLYRLSRQHPRVPLGRGWLVQLPEPSRPAFSFGRYVFLSPAHAQLSPAEYAQLLQHEQVHGAQFHSLDLLLVEVIGWFFWFNGLVVYLRRELRTVHEYLADAAVTRPTGNRAAYGRLLLKLAIGPLPSRLVHPFATKQVARRIHMLTHSPSSPMKKLRLLLILPVAALAWVGAAALGLAPVVAASATLLPTPPATALSRIGSITWQGNTFLTTAQLNEALGLKRGDLYNKQDLEARLNYRPDGQDVTSRYMDRGYLYFQINPVAKTQPDGTINLTFFISEGPVMRVSPVIIIGCRNSSDCDIQLPLRPGDLFSRAKLIQSQRFLAESGSFNPTKIMVDLNPQSAKGTVQVMFKVTPK